jgi:NAD(P)-dependent dehydrogenase (short-subunit alcohol dehydrogenase family)
MANHQIKGKTALIAGGAKNLGGLIACDLAAHGATAVAIHYHSPSSADDARETAAAIEGSGSKAAILSGDLTTAGAVAQLFEDAEAAVGKIDIAINTTGMVLKKPILDVSEKEFDEMFAINAKTAFFFMKEAGLRVKDHGRSLRS